MPAIPEFDAGNLKLNPTEVGVEARAGTARRVGMFYNQQAGAEEMLARETERLGGETQQLGRETEQLGSEKGAALAATGRAVGSSIEAGGAAAVQYLEHKDISQGAPAFARLMEQKTQQWNDAVKNADPNDPTVAAKFMDSLEGDLTKFRDEGFLTEGGQKWAEAHVDALRQHMAEKTQADMSTLAGQAAVVNQQQTINSLSSTVHGDPSSLDFSLAALKSSTEGMISSSPNLTGTQAGSARAEILQKGAESIVKSAAIGYIEKTATVPPWATDPKYAKYINGAELKTFENAAKTQAKVDFLQNKAIEAYQDKQRERAATAELGKNFGDNVTFDADGRVTINPRFYDGAMSTVRKYPGAADEVARAQIQFGEHQQSVKRETIVTDPTVQGDLLSRMNDPKNQTTETQILMEANKNKLDAHATSNLLALRKAFDEAPIKDPVFHATLESAKAIIHQSLDGPENFGKFAYQFMTEYQRLSRAGELKPDDLDMTKDDSLISKMMKPYKPSPEKIMQYHIMKNIGTDLSNIQNFNVGGGKRNDVMPAIPPAAQRPPGSIYETPKGKLKWTGTGWVTP